MARLISDEPEEMTYAVAQVITVAKFRRPANPRRCDVHRYHVWVWKSRQLIPLDELKAHIPNGLKCQCGAIEA